jgi:NMD protein affecting ribosome stability and mRNA decay
MRFCPKCGKRGIKGDFCRECAEEESGLQFKDVVIKKCIECDNIMVRHQWQRFDDPAKGMIKAAETRIKNPKGIPLEILPHYTELKNKPGAEQDIELEIRAEAQEFMIPAKILFTYCPNCAKAGTEYFEGVLQLRETTPELMQFVRKDIAEHEKQGVHIAKEVVKGTSADFKMSSAKYMRALGKRLKKRFNGELSEAVKLFSKNKQTGKEIYRVNVLFRLRKYRVGDVVESRGRKIRIKTMGKKVSGLDIETGKKVFVE